MIWTGHTGLVTETGKMVSHELLLSNLPAMPPEIKFIHIRKIKSGKKILITESLMSRRYHLLKEAQEKYRKVRRKECLEV